MSRPTNLFYEFGRFRVDVAERLLFREGTPLSLPPKAFDILLVLISQSGHVLEKRELIKTVWPDTFIEENNLTQYISALRRVLGDDRHEQHYIETVARRGYRFIAPVTQVQGDRDLVVENRTRVRIVIKEEREEREQELVIQAHAAPISSSARKSHRRVLTGYAILALLLTGIVLSVYWLASRARQPLTNAAVPNINSIAVLPFKPRAGETDQYLGLALAHDLSTRLSQDGLHPLPVSAGYRYLDDQGDPIRAGRELGVDAVIYGNLKKSGRRIAIDIQLARVGDGVLLWKESLEDETRNTFALQNSIASAVTHVLSVKDTEDIESSPPAGTVSLDAYEACEKGWFFLSKRTAESIHLSVGYFERAITEDPSYALAYAGLAEAYAFDIENWRKAESTALKALEIDKNLAEAHAIVGFVHMFWLWDWEAAEREFKRAIELNSNCATAHEWYASYLAAKGKGLEAKEEMRRALEIDPFSVPINADMGQMFYFSQDYDRAIEQCLKTIAMDPDFLNAHIYLYESYTQRGIYDKAFAEYFNIQRLAAGNLLYSPAAEESLRKGYQESGIKGFWRARLAFLEKRSNDDLAVAEYCARLGEKDRALTLLEQAYDRHNFGLALIAINPIFSEFSTGARFVRLNHRIFPGNANADKGP